MFLVYTIIVLSIVLHLFRFYPDRPVLVFKTLLFSALCLTEICYLFTAEDCQWFLDFKKIGYWKMLGGFIVLAFILLNQYGVFRILLYELSPDEVEVNYHIGLYSYTLSVVAIIFCMLFIGNSDYVGYIICFLFAAQLIQLILIFYQSRPYWKAALVGAFIYLLGTITFIIVLYHYAGPLAIAVFLIVAFNIIISVAKARMRQRDDY